MRETTWTNAYVGLEIPLMSILITLLYSQVLVLAKTHGQHDIMHRIVGLLQLGGRGARTKLRFLCA